MNISLEECARISEIVTAVCAVIGLTFWKGMSVIAFSRIINIWKREKWIWLSRIAVPSKLERKTNRDLWNLSHDNLGKIKSNVSMDTMCQFDNFGKYHNK
jgi:hypothetical protein